jgi:hypothetical protein
MNGGESFWDRHEIRGAGACFIFQAFTVWLGRTEMEV